MKIKLLILFTCISIACMGQDSSGNFYSKKNDVFWKRQFDTNMTFQELVKELKKANILTNIDTFDNNITGQTVESYMDYKGAGYGIMSTPSLFVFSTYRSFVLIEWHDSSYIVTVSKIVFINQNDTKLISPTFGSSHGELYPIEGFAIKKTGEFRKGFIKPSGKIIDYTFTKTYQF